MQYACDYTRIASIEAPVPSGTLNAAGMRLTNMLLASCCPQGIGCWTASMTATMVSELSSRLLTSPSTDKVWPDDWEVTFRKLVQRYVMIPFPIENAKNDRPHIRQAYITIQLKRLLPAATDSRSLRNSGAAHYWLLKRKDELMMQNQHQAMPLSHEGGRFCSEQFPAKPQKLSPGRRRQSLPAIWPSLTPASKPASRGSLGRISAENLPVLQDPAAPVMRSAASLSGNHERLISRRASTTSAPPSSSGSFSGSLSSSAASQGPSGHAKRMAAVRAMDANSKLWRAKPPVPKGKPAAAGNAGLPRIPKPVGTSQSSGGPISGPTVPRLTSPNDGQDGDDVDDLRTGIAKSAELKAGNKVSDIRKLKASKSKRQWKSAKVKLKAVRDFADVYGGAEGLRDAANEWDENRRQNRIEGPKQVLLKLAEKGENGTRKHRLLRKKSVLALRQVFQGISLTDDNGYITVHDFVRHVKASAPMLVDQATRMFDKLHNMTESDDSQVAEGTVDFSKLLRCLWPGLSEDQVKSIASMAKSPGGGSVGGASKQIDTVKEVYDVLNSSKSGFLSREEALKGIDDGHLVTEVAELNYLFGPPNTSYARSHVHFEEFFAWWCSDLHAAIKEYIDGQQ